MPFVFCGLWPWLAFQDACLRSVTVIVENAQLMKRVQFPSELLVVSAVVSSFVSHAVGFGLMLIGVAVWQGGVSPVAVGLLAVPFSLQLLLAVALGLLLSPAMCSCATCRRWSRPCLRCVFSVSGSVFDPDGPVRAATRSGLESSGPHPGPVPGLILTPEQVVWGGVLYPLLVCLVLLGVAQRVFAGCKGYFADYL